MAYNLHIHPNYAQTKDYIPQSSYGATAALRLFEKYLDPGSSYRNTYHYYFKATATDADTAPGLGAAGVYAGNTNISTRLAEIGKGHARMLLQSRISNQFMLTRFGNPVSFDIDRYDKLLLEIDNTEYTKAMTAMNNYFINLGSAYGISPALVKAAFVTVLKMCYEKEPVSILWADSYGVSSETLYNNIERLWGTQTLNIPPGYYATAGAYYPGAIGGGGGGRRKSKRRRKRYY